MNTFSDTEAEPQGRSDRCSKRTGARLTGYSRGCMAWERGGYYHIYIGREPEAMAEMMLGNTKKWYDRVTALLDGAVRSDEVLLELTASREDLDIFPIREREKRATRPRTGGMGTRRRKTSSGVEKKEEHDEKEEEGEEFEDDEGEVDDERGSQIPIHLL